MAEKHNINEKVVIKAKNIPTMEYEAIMDVYRASMLFFEKEMRKLRDRKAIRGETLKSITKKLDFSDLTHLQFSTLEPIKLVKMTQVKQVIQEFAPLQQPFQSPVPLSPPSANQPLPPTKISFSSAPPPTNMPYQSPSPEEQEMSSDTQLPKPIIEESNKHILPSTQLSAKDTATAVMELRKLMIENLKKFKQKYQD
ncbi:MAG: hypothetical protein HeimC3_24510 [Candidatus Heimdallarchaeota archaeon LC_3]|nr:MAG: hypothetical protein HeimC3_24510 [Candidatus Heimdallarchaeota archaeon LC_3]